MNIDDAQRFVQQMRDDPGFRQSVIGFSASSELWDFLKHKGYEFEPCHLVKAMAGCMTDMEKKAKIQTD